MIKALRNAQYRLDHMIAARNGQCSAGAKVVLDVDDDENILGGYVHETIT